jgi:hypothetical protein
MSSPNTKSAGINYSDKLTKMEDPTGESTSIGNFIIDLNQNGSISVYANKGAIVIKPATGSSVIIYSVTSGRNPEIVNIKSE